MKTFIVGLIAALIGAAIGWIGRSQKPAEGADPKGSAAEEAARKARAEEEKRIEETDSHDLVAGSPDHDAHSERVDKLASEFRERVRNRLESIVSRTGGS